ncbi:MAG: hypothetical protein EZS28_026702, partial [Streblomastix strix]
MMFLYSQ